MAMGIKKYIVTSSGSKKDTGELYCWATAIVETKSGAFLSKTEQVQLDDLYPVGTLIEVQQQILTQKK